MEFINGKKENYEFSLVCTFDFSIENLRKTFSSKRQMNPQKQLKL